MSNIDVLKSIILKSFPSKLVQALNEINFEKVEEIRIRANNPVILKIGNTDIVLKYKITLEEILNILQIFCSNSIYTYQNQICNGFITIQGGHRIGIAGTVVMKDGKASNISNIFSLNIRVAKEIKGSSNSILQYVLNIPQNTINNSLIVSPPRSWKNHNYKGFNQ
jgi:stage III sporulation protein AA